MEQKPIKAKGICTGCHLSSDHGFMMRLEEVTRGVVVEQVSVNFNVKLLSLRIEFDQICRPNLSSDAPLKDSLQFYF